MDIEPTVSFSFLTTRQALKNRICRICGCQRTNAVFLNLMEPAYELFLPLVQNIFLIQISEDDRLPKHICHACAGTLSDIRQLIIRSQVVQQNWAIIAKELNSDEENDDTEYEERCTIVDSKESLSDNSVYREKSSVKQISCPRMPSVRVPKLFDRQKLNRGESKRSPSSKIPNSDTTHREALCNTSKSDREREPLDVDLHPARTTKLPDSNPNSNVKSINWQIHKLPGSETILYVCSECHAVLVRPEAMDKHMCKSTPDRESSSSNSYVRNGKQKEITETQQDDSDDSNPSIRRTRTQIIHSDSSDDE